MESKRIYSINTGERPYQQLDDDVVENWYHAFLALIDESASKRTILQELHFKNSTDWEVVPSLRKTERELLDSDEVHIFPYVMGDSKDIMRMWNHAIKQALNVRNRHITFDFDFKERVGATNCRSGVKSMIESMGLTFSEDFAMSVAGTRSQKMGEYPIFSFNDEKAEDSIDPFFENQELWKSYEQ